MLVLPGGGMDLGRAGTILAPVRIEGVPPSLKFSPRFVLVSDSLSSKFVEIRERVSFLGKEIVNFA